MEGKEGAGVHGGAVGVLGRGMWVGGVLADETGREESVDDLWMTDVGGSALTEDLADD